MSDITQLRERVKNLLHDGAGNGWSEGELDEAVRTALDEYSRSCPLVCETDVMLEAAGREVPLTGLAGLRGVIAVWWPYENPAGPDNLAAGFRVNWNGDEPTLVLSSFRGRLPRPGDQARIWYTTPHKIEGLDGAAATTLPIEDESLVALGACGYAAAGAAVDRNEVIDPEHTAGLSKKLLESFRASLDNLKRYPLRTAGAAWGSPSAGGWRMDGWDGSRIG